jgi:hypothetical protein
MYKTIVQSPATNNCRHLKHVCYKNFITALISSQRSMCIPNIFTKLNSVAVVRKRTIPTEQPPLVGEVSANLCG